MLIISIPTVLIPAQQWARRSRKGRGSVACTEKGEGSGATRSQPFARVSRIWLGCIPKDEIEWGRRRPLCHTVDKVAYRLLQTTAMALSSNQRSRHTPNEGANAVESQPKCDAGSRDVNTGSSTLVEAVNSHQYDDGVPILPNGWPVMGSAVGNQSSRGAEYKRTAMLAKAHIARGKGNSFCFQSTARKEDC